MENISSADTVLWAKCKHPSVWQDVFLSTGQKHLAALVVGTGTRNSCLSELSKCTDMSGKPADKDSKNLIHPIRTRVNKQTYERLENLLQNSTCQSMGELARKLITREKINCFYKDVTMNAPMEELTSIRKELKSIGININQITRSFNQEKAKENSRQYYVMQVADLYKKVDTKVDRLLLLIAKLTEKWLQK